MRLEIKWREEDQDSKLKDRSLAKVAEFKLGTKSFTSPSRGIKVSKTTSDFALWSDITNDLLPPQGLAVMHMKVYPETLENLTHTNGKFNEKVTETSESLGQIPSSSVRIIYPRVPKSLAEKTSLTFETVKASLDFLNSARGNDVNILPIPPLPGKIVVDSFNQIRRAVNEVYETTGKSKPLAGYIPPVEDPLIAARIATEYVNGLNPEVRLFIVDFSNGRKDRSALEVYRALIPLRKRGDIKDFYIHAVNVPKDMNRQQASPIYDLTLPIEGVDSFNNILWPVGGPGKSGTETVLEANKKKKYCLKSQYGNFSYAELESRRLLGEKCVCPVCKGHTLKEVYSTANHDLFIDKLQVHRMFLQMSETDEYRQILHESGSVLDYMRDKPMVQNQVNTIVRDLIGKTT